MKILKELLGLKEDTLKEDAQVVKAPGLELLDNLDEPNEISHAYSTGTMLYRNFNINTLIEDAVEECWKKSKLADGNRVSFETTTFTIKISFEDNELLEAFNSYYNEDHTLQEGIFELVGGDTSKFKPYFIDYDVGDRKIELAVDAQIADIGFRVTQDIEEIIINSIEELKEEKDLVDDDFSVSVKERSNIENTRVYGSLLEYDVLYDQNRDVFIVTLEAELEASDEYPSDMVFANDVADRLRYTDCFALTINPELKSVDVAPIGKYTRDESGEMEDNKITLEFDYSRFESNYGGSDNLIPVLLQTDSGIEYY